MARPTLILVFEFLDHDLKQYMVAKQGKGKGLPLSLAKVRTMKKGIRLEKQHSIGREERHPLILSSFRHFSFSRFQTATQNFCYQILTGLRYCHAHSVMHRDLKPQNILVSNKNIVKLADFGLGRVFSLPVGKYTHEVVTPWYRAPEVLLGTRCYSTGIDVWSVGCILAEMVTGKPLFYAEGELEQLLSIFRYALAPLITVRCPAVKAAKAKEEQALTHSSNATGSWAHLIPRHGLRFRTFETGTTILNGDRSH